jgi:antibiotic biosynthesis monooxygenase (ABM) superfamily enzyme
MESTARTVDDADAASTPSGTGGRTMKAHRVAVVVWLAIYATITLLLAILGPQIATWPLPLRTLVLTGIAVPLMVFVLLPGLQRALAPWLRR